jgi:hypothetical protein
MPYLSSVTFNQLMVDLGKTKVMIFNGLKKTMNLHFFFKGEEIEITNTYIYLGVQFLGPTSVCDQPSSLGSTRDIDPYPFSRDNDFDIIFKTSHPRCPSWTPLSDPLFSMAHIFGGLLYLSPIGPLLRESKTFSSCASLDATRTIPHHIILVEFGSNPSDLR